MAVEKRWVIKDADNNILNEFVGVANDVFVGEDFNGVTVASVEQIEDVTIPSIAPPSFEQRLRSERNRLLIETDWTQLPDSPLTDKIKQEWAIYRQALRDLPETTEDFVDPVWPEQPKLRESYEL